MSLLSLAVILSIDSLGVGITYGTRNMKITFLPKVILFLISFLMILFSVFLGNLLLTFLPIFVTNFIGSFILIIIGLFVIFQNIKKSCQVQDLPLHHTEAGSCKNSSPRTIQFFIRSLGITVQIMKDPICSDLDGSQSIDMKEAVFLGLALSSDAIGSGIGFSMLGANSLLFPLIAACFQLGFLSFRMLPW